MPAGHSCPPHPSLRSCWSCSGGVKSPSKSTKLVVGARWFGDWINSSPMVRGLGSSSSDEWLGEVIVECGLRIMVVIEIPEDDSGAFPSSLEMDDYLCLLQS